MKNWSTLILIIFCLEWTIPVNGRHRHGLLAECTKCRPGESLTRKCTRHHDSECIPCSLGTYQPHHSYRKQCYLCSKCGDGLYVAHSCTFVSDTVCDSCHTYKGPHNIDYYKKCFNNQQNYTHFRNGSTKVSENRHLSITPMENLLQQSYQRSLLLCTAALVMFVCFIILFLLANRRCKNHRKMVKPDYTYQVVNTQESVPL